VLQQMLNNNDTLAAPYIAFLVRTIQPLNNEIAQQLLTGLAKKYPDNIYVADAIISNLQNKEAAFYKESLKITPDTNAAINRRLKKVIDDITKAKNNANAQLLAKQYPKGVALFQSVCQTCHGTDGNGVSGLGPPLNNSEWVQGDKNKVIPIVLYGLAGPVKVTGKLYTSPEITGEMPGIGANKEYTNEDIAQVLSLVRHSWNNNASQITANDISNVRNKFKDRQTPFSMEELNQLK
jgi:mono/diheme cytochrome c family protein